MSSANNNFLTQLCLEWVSWTKTRRFYVNTYAGDSLARLTARPSGQGEHDGYNYPDMQYFNMALHTLSDMAKYKDEWAVFKAHYLSEAGRTVAKATAYNLGICRRTYYNRLDKFAKAAYSMSLSLKKAHEAMSASTARPAAAAAH